MSNPSTNGLPESQEGLKHNEASELERQYLHWLPRISRRVETLLILRRLVDMPRVSVESQEGLKHLLTTADTLDVRLVESQEGSKLQRKYQRNVYRE